MIVKVSACMACCFLDCSRTGEKELELWVDSDVEREWAAMQRFFVEPGQISGDEKQIVVTGGDVNHMKNVLRMAPGEEVRVSDGREEYRCVIEGYPEDQALLHIEEICAADYELANKIYLFQGLPKADKMELIIQKAVELGVFAVIPVSMKRCVVKLEKGRADKKQARWQQISESAAKQSKRMVIPEVFPVTAWKEALEFAGKLDVWLLPYENAQGMDAARKAIAGIASGQSVGVFIGPEGGFDPEEVRQAAAAGAVPITLGKRILRTETAGLAVLSVLMFHLEAEEQEGISTIWRK